MVYQKKKTCINKILSIKKITEEANNRIKEDQLQYGKAYIKAKNFILKSRKYGDVF